MVVLGWTILVLFGAAYLFGVPLLVSQGYEYWRALASWLGLLAAVAICIFLVMFAVVAVSGG